jgi:hypothetical protein
MDTELQLVALPLIHVSEVALAFLQRALLIRRHKGPPRNKRFVFPIISMPGLEDSALSRFDYFPADPNGELTH